jgi:hypothetical protein
MFKRISILLTVTLLLLLASTTVLADGSGYPWLEHAAPFDFKFNNLIDNHQQSKLVRRGMLQGFVYIQFTGEEIDGVPVAVRADCDNPVLDCRVGWKVEGIPAKAKLVNKGPRKWIITEQAQLHRATNYLHFHWTDGPPKPCGLTIEEQVYDGYLLKRTAITEFYWLGGNPSNSEGGRLVTPGMDLHSNIVTDWDGNGGSGGGSGSHDDGGCGGHDDGGHDDGGHDDGGTGGAGGTGGSDGSGEHSAVSTDNSGGAPIIITRRMILASESFAQRP